MSERENYMNVEEYDAICDAKDQEIDRLSFDNSRMDVAVHRCQDEYERVLNESEDLEDEITDLKKKIGSLVKENEDLKKRIRDLVKRLP